MGGSSATSPRGHVQGCVGLECRVTGPVATQDATRVWCRHRSSYQMLRVYRAVVQIGAVIGSAARDHGNGGMVKRRNAVAPCTVLISDVFLYPRVLIVCLPYKGRVPGPLAVPVLTLSFHRTERN